jgi:hypothetical protein
MSPARWPVIPLTGHNPKAWAVKSTQDMDLCMELTSSSQYAGFLTIGSSALTPLFT